MSSSEEEEFTGDPEEEEEEEFVEEEEDDDDEDEPLASLKVDRKRAASKISPSYNEGSSVDEESSSDDDDDIPLSALAEKASPKKNGKKKAAPSPKKKAKNSVTKKKKKKKAPPKKKESTLSSTSSSKNYEWASAALYGTECDKGLLIQRLLCRWWYAFNWPDPEKLPEKPPKNYDSLDGFPGVYVCSSGDQVGQLKDLRDATAAPTFRNFAKKSSEELKELLLKALGEQKKQLVAADGPGTSTEKELDRLIKWCNKVNATKAEKDAAKVLKSQGLKLPE